MLLTIVRAPCPLLHVTNCRHHMNTKTAQISVGMGTLAGSTVMLLTIVWGGSVLLGRCDLDPDTGAQRDKTLTARWHDLTSSGVSTDEQTTKSARAMLASAGLFVFIQVRNGSGGPHNGGAKWRRRAAGPRAGPGLRGGRAGAIFDAAPGGGRRARRGRAQAPEPPGPPHRLRPRRCRRGWCRRSTRGATRRCL